MSDQENFSEAEYRKAMFMHLVMSISQSALMHMGKLVNPSSGKSEVNLEAAQSSIDMLETLEIKSRGNLDTEEAAMMKQALTALQMNFVETAGVPAAAAAAAPAPTSEITPPPSAPPADEPAEDKKKFHKKY